MGFSISGILAILFIDKLKIIALSSHLMISPSKRYCFVLFCFFQSYPCILDVVSLYTTIPVQEAITNVTDRIQNPLSKQDVSDLLQVTLNNMYLSLKDQVFRQKRRPTHGF